MRNVFLKVCFILSLCIMPAIAQVNNEIEENAKQVSNTLTNFTKAIDLLDKAAVLSCISTNSDLNGNYGIRGTYYEEIAHDLDKLIKKKEEGRISPNNKPVDFSIEIQSIALNDKDAYVNSIVNITENGRVEVKDSPYIWHLGKENDTWLIADFISIKGDVKNEKAKYTQPIISEIRKLVEKKNLQAFVKELCLNVSGLDVQDNPLPTLNELGLSDMAPYFNDKMEAKEINCYSISGELSGFMLDMTLKSKSENEGEKKISKKFIFGGEINKKAIEDFTKTNEGIIKLIDLMVKSNGINYVSALEDSAKSGRMEDNIIIDHLISLLNNDEVMVKYSSILLLGNIKNKRASDALIEALNKEKNVFARKMIIYTLGQTKNQEAIPVLEKISNDGQDKNTRIYSEIALCSLEGKRYKEIK